MGTVDGCGYNGQLKYNICDTCRLCHLILSILKPVFHHLWHIHCAHNFLWCLDLHVWRFLCPRCRQHGGQITELLQALHCYTPMHAIMDILQYILYTAIEHAQWKSTWHYWVRSIGWSSTKCTIGEIHYIIIVKHFETVLHLFHRFWHNIDSVGHTSQQV